MAAVLGLIIGVVIGVFVKPDIPVVLQPYLPIMVVAAIDGEALNTVMNEAGEAGIPIIAYDRLIMNDNVSYYVSFDNYTVGTLQGQYLSLIHI